MSYQLEAVPGIFRHTEEGFEYPTEPLPSFGLLDESPSRWQTFAQKIADLQRNAAENECYKVFFIARHGQGYHNLAHDKYGPQAFAEKWAKLETDGELVWGPDPLLTPLGQEQAAKVGAAYLKESKEGMPLPTSFYTSPLSRAIMTLDISFRQVGVIPKANRPPKVIENLREGLNIFVERDWGYMKPPEWVANLEKTYYTDNARRTKSEIKQDFPFLTFEEGFSETDDIWKPELLETTAQQIQRTRGVLERIFAEDKDDTYVAISAHGGTCLCIQKIFGFNLILPPVCSVIPVVVKATKI